MAPAAHRRFSQFISSLKERIRTEAKTLADDPYRWEELKGPLKGLRSCKFSFKGTRYRIAYRINATEHVIEIALVGPRQNFYEMLRRIIQR